MARKYVGLIPLLILLLACETKVPPGKSRVDLDTLAPLVSTHYELVRPTGAVKHWLILFGGYPEEPADIRREFGVAQLATENGIAVMWMKFNQRLWLEKEEKQALSHILLTAAATHQLPADQVYLGGFSSGGNIALLLANYLVEQQTPIQAKGVFVVDSPLDLLALYRRAAQNVERNFSPIAVQESKAIVAILNSFCGDPEEGTARYAEYSPYLTQEHNVDNLRLLRDTEIRLYTEPDTAWWRANRQNTYEDLNAYTIRQLATQLQAASYTVQLIETEGQGRRASGERHPHSWSIVDKADLVRWILAEE